jgi:hypothetical protein
MMQGAVSTAETIIRRDVVLIPFDKTNDYVLSRKIHFVFLSS